ncbi:hypothetical protein COCMIDRAFT_1450 [Bipolaris oryzae ATCC 44560]|uniref:Uncharacterized protein n=1 Tax=Bipolaris oryzae ATCC 44560 TaxID=930090 RepID=W6ZDD0_COCMI|nr:uncharacterized protein COCMIDRAFT_1450 [Bipolaris oryzae ATCC 44560]EUC49822.1 hypothetical protein COCMIDRAFT_1450 [Bipolaris oryzae ATCC 44560]
MSRPCYYWAGDSRGYYSALSTPPNLDRDVLSILPFFETQKLENSSRKQTRVLAGNEKTDSNQARTKIPVNNCNQHSFTHPSDFAFPNYSRATTASVGFA